MSSLNQNTNIMWSTIGNTCLGVIRFAFTEGAVDKNIKGVSHKDLYEIK